MLFSFTTVEIFPAFMNQSKAELVRYSGAVIINSKGSYPVSYEVHNNDSPIMKDFYELKVNTTSVSNPIVNFIKQFGT